MLRLNVNPDTVQALLSALQGTQEEVGLLASIVHSHGANPGEFYAINPPPDAPLATIQQTPAAQAGDWSHMVHPHVAAQLLVNLCERLGSPLPDNLHVAIDGVWQPLLYVQPTLYNAAPPPSPPPALAPAPAPATALPFPEPERISATKAPEQTQLPLRPEPPAPKPEPEPMVTREILGAQVSMPASTAQHIDDNARVVPPAVSTEAFAPVGLDPVDTSPATTPIAAAGFGAFGLPLPTMVTAKGVSPFDKDPGGELPKGAPPRQLRDMSDMANRLFASLAGDVVGKGTGAVQRHRYYTTLLALVDRALASVPDEACTVGYLRWHISHLRFNAAQSAAGARMTTFEQWGLADHKEKQ